MASLYSLKPRFQQLLAIPTAWLYQHGVSANQVTIAAAAGSLGVGGVLLVSGDVRVFLLLPVFLFVRMALNAIDGMLARQYHMQSRLGAMLNEMGDVISDAALYLPFALLPGVNPAVVVALVVLAVMGEMVGVLGVVVGASRRYDGPLGKSDRALVFGVLSLLLGLALPIAPYLNMVFALLVALAAVTIINRARRALREAGA